MNKNALQIILYSGIFSTAYAGFFYQKYVDAGVAHDMAQVRPASSGANASLRTAVLQSTTFEASRRHQTSSQDAARPTAPSETAVTEKGRREKGRLNDKIKIHRETSRKTSGRNSSSLSSSSHNIQAVISSAASSGDQRGQSDSQKQTETAASTDNYNTSTSLAYAANPVTYTSLPAQSGTADNAISSYHSPAIAETGTATNANSSVNSDADSQDNSFAGSTPAGDGSEFLPDGSSQQDLVDSLSKKPRVYTLKDYQQADISCASAYSSPTAHAELIYGLKGC
jgi:hypothetical protein